MVIIWAVTGVVGALTLHTAFNATLLRRSPPARTVRPTDQPTDQPTDRPDQPDDGATRGPTVAVLLPVRDEAVRVGACLRGLLGQRDVADLEIIVLDDGSTDGTADVIRAALTGTGDTIRVRLITGDPLPPGWLGKPHACAQLAASTTADVLVFVDADVVLAPHAVAAGVALLDGVTEPDATNQHNKIALLSPYPRIVGQDLVQPLLQWSWLTFLPLRAMERSPRESLAAAGGQFLVVRAGAYAAAGGHGAVRDRVLEDLALARAVKRTGGRIALADGSRLATCRMYPSWRELTDGYAKSLWASFGSPAGAAVVVAVLQVLYVVPFVAMLTGSVAGLVGYALAVTGRMLSARATGGRWIAAFAHPVSIVIFGALVILSFARRRRGDLRWKGRPVGCDTPMSW
ncbi:MAG: hypothetical protein QOI74_23 [Micromonosporaceae bacterium]|nr:hypothetical protein [Micromonosporaceae bacterium]